MVESVFIIGATGKIGSELARQIISSGDTDSRRHRNPTRIVGVASSSGFLYDASGISDSDVLAFSTKRTRGREHAGLGSLFDFLGGIEKPVRIVDVTASPEMLWFHKRIISETCHSIVTANKLPLVLNSFDDFQLLTASHGRYAYSCSVMAGAEAVSFMRDIPDLGESFVEITGSFSGTLGYVSSELGRGSLLSEAVRKALEKGYTEPNPSIDLSGKDLAYKILTLARTAGMRVDLEEIKLTPFVPDEYLSYGDPELLLGRLRELDSAFASRIALLKGNGKALRYVARLSCAEKGGVPSVTVGLEELEVIHPLAQLQGTANMIIIRAGPYGVNGNLPYIIEAPGAGIDITARNIRRDLLSQIEDRHSAPPEQPQP
jgi:aspartokinase/homoserine dehydrogenase 1